jgi:hypothetical protein
VQTTCVALHINYAYFRLIFIKTGGRDILRPFSHITFYKKFSVLLEFFVACGWSDVTRYFRTLWAPLWRPITLRTTVSLSHVMEVYIHSFTFNIRWRCDVNSKPPVILPLCSKNPVPVKYEVSLTPEKVLIKYGREKTSAYSGKQTQNPRAPSLWPSHHTDL